VDVGEMQKKLSQWAQENPTEQRRDLYSLLCNELWLRVAHHHVNSNQGRETAGIDSITMSNFNGNLAGNLERLKEALNAKAFEPMPVRRVYIPKANGKKRPLGIPTIHDRIVQEALRMILEPIWESDFSTHSYGFRPNRSTYDAVSYIANRSTGQGKAYQWVIEGDITSYFDTIPHRRLIKAIKKRVADRDIRALLWKFLRAGVMEQGTQKATLTGTPQGGILSPLLANIYLHELDKHMESKYLNLSDVERARRRRQGQSNFLYVRYADDWVVLCNGTKEQAYTMKEELQTVLENMGLKLSEEKTKITHITEGFSFLGYRIIREMGTSKMVTKVEIPEAAMKKFRHKTREMLAPRTTKESMSANIIALNQFIRGWCNYYKYADSPQSTFSRLSHKTWWFFGHFLARGRRSSIKSLLIWATKTGKSKVVTKGNSRRLTFTTQNGKREMYLDIFPPKTAEILAVSNKETWTADLKPVNPMNWMQGRSAATRLTALARSEGICERCGENPAAQVHHRNRMKHKRTMLAKVASDKDQRTQAQARCKECHLDVHHGNFNG